MDGRERKWLAGTNFRTSFDSSGFLFDKKVVKLEIMIRCKKKKELHGFFTFSASFRPSWLDRFLSKLPMPVPPCLCRWKLESIIRASKLSGKRKPSPFDLSLPQNAERRARECPLFFHKKKNKISADIEDCNLWREVRHCISIRSSTPIVICRIFRVLRSIRGGSNVNHSMSRQIQAIKFWI